MPHPIGMTLHFEDVDPIATCLVETWSANIGSNLMCGWRGHGDSIKDAVLAWANHVTAAHRDDWED